MKAHVLLISNSQQDPWSVLVRDTIREEATVAIVDPNDATGQLATGTFTAVILDETAVSDAPRLVRSLRSQDSGTPILVATSSPTWKRAKESFRAGANNYIYATFDRNELLLTLSEAFHLIKTDKT